MSSYNDADYWNKFYNDKKIVGSDDFQKNVGRTKGGAAITRELWDKTLEDIKKIVALNRSQKVVELCCGNGEVIGNLAPECKEAIGVDYSKELLDQLKSRFGKDVKTVHANVMDVSFDKRSLDTIIIYFSIQYFNEKETVQLIKRSLGWLKKGGKLFIGDIPNELKKWDYIDRPAYRRDYLQRALNEEPMIGNWYQPKFFEALASYFNNVTVDIIKQPKYQINSSCRFDILITKG